VLQTAILSSRHDALGAGAAILAQTDEAFDRRLDRGSTAPIAVGFSGGGDSLALLLATRVWALSAGRPVLALTVDHGLNPRGAAWTAQAAARASELGVPFQALRWEGEKPRTGVQAAARRARHARLAEAARQAGASVLLLGHTLDDVLEARWMRAHGSSVGSPRQWSPSPAWPQGRGVFLLRPLIGLRRAALRELLAPSGLDWIEDPANQDARFLRTHARRIAPEAEAIPTETPEPFGDARVDAAGAVRLDRESLIAMEPGAARRLLAMACVCAGGGDRLPRTGELDRLLARVAAGGAFAATLAGARLEVGEGIEITRDVGRASTAPEPLRPGAPVIWDGRFEIIAHRPGLQVRPLGGLMSRLEPVCRAALADFGPAARRALPAVTDPDGTVTCPILAEDAWSSVRGLVEGRLRAACGRIAREPPPDPGSRGERGSGALS
jgi:tRNA(Ile)-lysidine synthase